MSKRDFNNTQKFIANRSSHKIEKIKKFYSKKMSVTSFIGDDLMADIVKKGRSRSFHKKSTSQTRTQPATQLGYQSSKFELGTTFKTKKSFSIYENLKMTKKKVDLLYRSQERNKGIKQEKKQ